MTRRSVYGGAVVVFLATFAITIASVAIPRWISWDVSSDGGMPVHYTYGLHSRCNSVTQTCSYFPQARDCHGPDRTFCSLWRSVGFLMSFAVVLEGMTLIALVVLLLGGKQRRESGWRLAAAFLGLVGLVQCAAMTMMAFVYDNDERFFEGWHLDTSWALCTTSWVIQIFIAIGLAASAVFLPPEAGYELIPDS